MSLQKTRSECRAGRFPNFLFLKITPCLFLFFLLCGKASAQPLVCTDLIQVSLDFECKDTVNADEVLEGNYCCYDNYAVEIDKTPGGTDCDGIWDSNILYATDIGMTYCFRVSDPGTGDVCYGFIMVKDNIPPTVACPPDQIRNTDPGVCKYTAVGTEFDPLSYGDNCLDAALTWMLSGKTGGNGVATLAGKAFNRGNATIVKWTATDQGGNSATCTFTVTVNDLEDPTIACPADQSRNADAGQCDYTTVGTEFDPTAFGDNCPGTSLNYVLTGAVSWNGPGSLAGFVFPQGQTTVEWVVGDGNNQIATCSFTVTVSVPALAIACPAPQNRNTDPAQCQYTAFGNEFDPPTVGNGCGGTTSLAYTLSGATSGSGTTTTLASTAFQKGQTTVVWTVTDASNNTATCSFVVTVVDNEPPIIICPTIQTRNTNPNVCLYKAVGSEFNPLSFGDNCPGVSIAYVLSGATAGNGSTTLAGVDFKKGTTTVTWTVTDASNNTATCSFSVTVFDGQLPTVTCPGPQNRNTNTGVCTYTAIVTEFNPLSFGDNCPGASIAYALSGATSGNGATTLAGKVFQKGQTTVAWTATDASNNTATCSFSVTVNDAQPLTISCPGPQTRKTDNGVCTYTALGTEFDLLSVSSDNCPGVPAISYALSGATSSSGVNTLAGKIFQKGQTTVVWTATDASGNPASCSFVVTVNDLQAPAITCPGNQTRNTLPNLCLYIAGGAEFDPTSLGDNCPGAVGFSYLLTGATSDANSGSLAIVTFNKGITTVKWTATDLALNTNTCTFTVTVNDAQAPTILCPINQTRNTNAGGCTYTAVGGEFDPPISDNCPGVSRAYVLTGVTAGSGTATLAGKIFNKGITTVTWTATDAANNTASCVFTVEVKDGQGPGIICPFNQTRSTNLNLCSYATVGAEFNPLAVGDNCPGTVGISYTLTGVTTGTGPATLAGKVFNKGLTTVKWTATDATNNTGTCTFTVDVKDNQPPKFTMCPPVALYNINMTPGCTITIPNLLSYPNAAATDNCPGLTKTQAPAAGTVMTVTHNQNINVVLTAQDAAGNTATCGRIVKAKDVTAPTITTCPPNRTVQLSPDCKITVPDMRAELVATDCSLPLTVTQNPAQGTVLSSDAGDVFNVTMTVKDVAGNATTCTVVITAEFRYFAYITNYYSSDVSVINTTTNTVIATIPVASDPKGVSVSPDGNKIYLAHSSGYVSVIDASSNTVIATIVTGAISNSLVVTPDGNRVYVANLSPNTASVINTNTNTVVATIWVGADPAGVAVSPDGSKAYFTNLTSNTVTVINTSSNSVIATVGVGLFPRNVAVNPIGNRAYVANYYSNSVSIINTVTNTVMATVGVGLQPYGVAVSPNGSKIYVTNKNSNNVSIIDATSNAVISTIAVGLSPTGVSFTPDGSRVYVANTGSNTVSVINTTTNMVIATVGVGNRPYAFGNFIGGPLCLSGNNLVGDNPETAYAEPDTLASDRALDHSALWQVMPNPFTDALTVRFALEEPARVRVVLVDLTGRFVFLENENEYETGENRFAWNTEDLPEGAYLVGLKVEGQGWTYRKVMLMR